MLKSFWPNISVIVPIYNGEDDLPDLLACLRSQTYPPDCVEYLLVDNNSRDRTATLLNEEVRTASGQGIVLKSLAETQIQSSYAARNTGIQAAQGDILAFTDADCRPQSDWLARLVQPFADPRVGIVAGEILALPGRSLLEQYADRQETLSQRHTLTHPFCAYGQTANLAVRKQAFQQQGLFRPYLTTGGDADLCWRILRATDWQLEFVEEAIVRHRHRTTWQELRRQWQRYGRSNRYLHELHGIELQRELTPSEMLYRLTRWFAKELPAKSLKTALGKSQVVEMFQTPIDLFAFQARTRGQRDAKLPNLAQTIEWLQKGETAEAEDS